MAETGKSQQLISSEDEACDANREEEMQIVREVLRRTRIQIKKDLKPDDVLDVFLEDMFFGENTNIKVRDLKEQLTTTEKNDKIVDELARSSQKYVKFKTSLKRTGQDELLGCIEQMESTVHEEKEQNGDHACEYVNYCTLMAQLKCPGNIEPFVPKKVLGEFVKELTRRTRIQIKKDLKPDDVLDVFMEDKFFGENTDIKVRDIKEQRTTTAKNDQIIDESTRSYQKYIKFKTSLTRTGQNDLLGYIERMEITAHEERGKKYDHVCEAVNNCPLLAQLKCPGNIEPYVPKKVLDLRTVLLAVYKGMFQHITIFPGKTLDLEELYVKQEFKLIDYDRKLAENEKPGEQASVASVADILTKNGEICKNILISAEPGLGKSTFCKHLVRQWCKAHTLKDAKFTKDQKTLQRFELLFYIDLRDADVSPKVPKSDEISELIHEQLDLTDTCTITEIRNILSGTLALVVMDSLDELGSSRRPKRGIHNNSCIVTTSRPWKIELLRSEFIDVDQHIEIVGLAESSTISLANTVLNLLSTGSEGRPTKTGYQFIQAMEAKKLQDLLTFPLLVIQMLGLWFSGQTFGGSQFEIYGQVLHHQICTAVKTKLLPKDVCNGSKQKLPFCNRTEQCPCRAYGELLWNVAKLAYHTLFNKDRYMCLVFGHEVTKYHGLSTEKSELCLKIGILTQRIYISKVTDEHKYVSFPHKTYQEYFAAIFLSGEGQQSDLDHIRSVVSNLDRALELDKVLLFCSENNTAVASKLSRLISEIADKNSSVEEYRHSCDRYDAPYADLIEKIQNIIIPATQQNTKLFLSDIILEDTQWRPFERQDRKPFVHYLDLAFIKSLFISYPVLSGAEEKEILNLQKLVVCDSGIQVKIIHEMAVRNKATLETLALAGDDENGGKPLDMSSLGAKWRDMLTVNLSSLGLYNVNLSHKQCQDLSTFVAATNNLRQVKLEEISCETHGDYESGKCFVLDFQSNIKLHTIVLSELPMEDVYLKLNINLHTVELSELPIEDVHLHVNSLRSCYIDLPRSKTAQTSILKQLKDASELQELTCGDIDDTSSVILFLDILQNLHKLQRIKLNDVKFGDLHNVCLSATLDKLEHVELSFCTITSAGLRCLINSLPNHKVTVELSNVSVTDDENIFQEIRDSPNTNITLDDGVFKMGDDCMAGTFHFDNNYTRPGQA